MSHLGFLLMKIHANVSNALDTYMYMYVRIYASIGTASEN